MTKEYFEDCVMAVEGFSLSEDESEVNVQRGVVCKGMCTGCGWVLKELGDV